MISKAYRYLKNQPQGFMTLLLTETTTLFGYFGISSLLVLYMTNMLHVSDSVSFIVYGTFLAFYYATPIIGGPLADKILGFKQSVYIGLVLMIVGSFMLVSSYLTLFYLGLSFFAVGSGFFTPAFNTLVSKMYHLFEEKRDNAFTIYYMSKNLGALFAIVICSFIATHIGYIYAFILCGIIMFMGLTYLFFMKHHIECYLVKLKNIDILKLVTVIAVIIATIALTTLLMSKKASYIVMILMTVLAIIFMCYLYRKVQKSQKIDLLAIVGATVLFIIFGMLLGEGGTTLNLFIERIVNRNLLGVTIPPSTFYALDPLFMLLLGGIMMYCLSFLREKQYTILSYKKIILGLILLALGFLIFTVAAQQYISYAIKPSVLYVIVAYALFPLAELCISPIVLSMTTKLAPKGYEAMMVGFYLVGYALGFYLTGVFSIIGKVTPEDSLVTAATIYRNVFALSTAFLLVASLITYVGIRYYQSRQKKMLGAIVTA